MPPSVLRRLWLAGLGRLAGLPRLLAGAARLLGEVALTRLLAVRAKHINQTLVVKIHGQERREERSSEATKHEKLGEPNRPCGVTSTPGPQCRPSSGMMDAIRHFNVSNTCRI